MTTVNRPATTTFPRVGKVVATFSPKGDAEALIVAQIDSAKLSLNVQAYEFSSKPICDAIIRGFKRGLVVEVLLDKQNKVNPLSKWFNPVGKSSLLPALLDAKIAVLFDSSPTIAHSKIIIVDSAVVITGSFNFSAAAQNSNTENLLIIHDKHVAAVYMENFLWRLSCSHA